MYIKYPHSFRRNARLLVLSIFCLVGSFTLGIQTSGNVQPVQLIEAGGLHLPGDMDGSGVVDVSDAMIIIEIAQGYTTATSDQLRADPNGDGALTVDDALRILSNLSVL